MITPLPPYILLAPDQVDALTELVFGPTSIPQPADVGFVFGGTHPGLWETAIELYRAEYLQRFIVTGHSDGSGLHHPAWDYPPETPEACIIAELLVQAGVPREDIVIEDRSTNSLENVLFAMKLVDFNQYRSMLAITKSYATGRQLRTLKRHIPSSTTVFSVSFAAEAHNAGAGTVHRDNWTETELRVRIVLAAYQRIMKYGALGHIVPADPIRGVPFE